MQRICTFLRSPRGSKATVCLFFLLVLLTGLLTAADYGRPWDESDEMDILRSNLWEYTRAFGLDESLFQTWAAQEQETISPLTPISESIEQDHGIAAFYPLAWPVLNLHLTEHSRMVIWHLYCWLLFTLGMFALYACVRQLGMPRWAGLWAALFLLLSPRFFAEGHYNNKDVVLLSLALCVFWQGLRLMKKPTFGRAVLFGLVGALAANTKVVGFALWGLCALFVLIRQIAQRKLTPKVACIGGVSLLSLLGFYLLLTPAFWASPSAFLSYLVQNALAFGRWENYVRFRGTTFLLADQRLPWYYLPYMIVATTPPWLLLLMVVGQLFAVGVLVHRRKTLGKDDRLLGLGLCSLLWLLPLGFAIVTRTTVYNGWRHFYFLYGYLLILGAYGVWRLFQALRGKLCLRRILGIALALCFCVQAAGIILAHPYQYVYYQPAVRLLTNQDDLELDYWNLSVMNALEQLAAQQEGTLVIGYADLWAESGLKRTLPVLEPNLRQRFVLTEDATQADYVLVNPTYALFSGYEAAGEPVVLLTAYDRVMMEVIRNQ